MNLRFPVQAQTSHIDIDTFDDVPTAVRPAPTSVSLELQLEGEESPHDAAESEAPPSSRHA